MQGLVFNLLRDVVERDHGADTWDDVLEAAGSSGVHSSLGTYPDEELHALVEATADAVGIEDQDALRWIGRRALPRLAAAHPELFARHPSTRLFLLALNEVIHEEVRKLHPGAHPPTFGFELPDDDTLVLRYTSARQLCGLAEGFITGTAEHFGEAVRVHQSRCMLRGDEECLLHVTRA